MMYIISSKRKENIKFSITSSMIIFHASCHLQMVSYYFLIVVLIKIKLNDVGKSHLQLAKMHMLTLGIFLLVI